MSNKKKIYIATEHIYQVQRTQEAQTVINNRKRMVGVHH